MATVWPNVVNWLLTTLPTLPGWSAVAVIDAAPVPGGQDDTSYITVGYTGTGDTGGQYTQTESLDGFGVDEAGHVLCDLVYQTGDDQMSVVRSAAFALVDALRARVKSDRTLGGVLSPNGTVSISVDPLNVQNTAGVAQSLLLTFAYTTVTWN